MNLKSEFESGLVDQAGITRPGGLRATHRADLFALKMESYFSVLIVALNWKKLSVLIIFMAVNYAKIPTVKHNKVCTIQF